MCSIGEDDFGDEGAVHTMKEGTKSPTIGEEMCRKCLVIKCSVKLDKKDSMCEKCFLVYVRHKFRASLGSTKVVKRQSNVLLDFDGSKPSAVLIHMLKFAFNEDEYKKLCLNLNIIYVDDYCTESSEKYCTVEYRMNRIQEIKDVMDQYPNFTCSYASIAGISKYIEDIKKISNDDMQEVIQSEVSFVHKFNSLKTLTSKQDFLENSRRNVLLDVASKVDCPFIFVSDIAIDLAKRLISNIALGRGSTAAYNVSFCDDKLENFKFIRPIKDLNQKEIDNYIKFNNLKVIPKSAYGNDLGESASIQNLTSQFVDGLQDNYPSTVSTVYKCCTKIAPKKFDSPERCNLCKSQIDHYNSETLYAVEFSSRVSEMANNIEKMEKLIQDSLTTSKPDKLLCHTCQNIYAEINN